MAARRGSKTSRPAFSRSIRLGTKVEACASAARPARCTNTGAHEVLNSISLAIAARCPPAAPASRAASRSSGSSSRSCGRRSAGRPASARSRKLGAPAACRSAGPGRRRCARRPRRRRSRCRSRGNAPEAPAARSRVERPAGRVVRRIDEQDPGVGSHRRDQRGEIEAPGPSRSGRSATRVTRAPRIAGWAVRLGQTGTTATTSSPAPTSGLHRQHERADARGA